MKFIKTDIPDVLIISPKIFRDERGYFCETFRQDELEKQIGKVNFVQDNESKSSLGVLRGLHYQRGEYAQAKLVRVITGAVLDVAVDIRKESPYYGKYVAVELNEVNKLQLYIPRGFAHGFLVLSNSTIFSYKVDNVYSPENEAGILYNDPDIGIDWRVNPSIIKLSDKDKALVPLSVCQ
ncbi:MAG: dTDP-4-dehydrorhamnose 3,5-epimerase [Prevotellaceae bacterium]|jgi:dTDP-4-dehydrorhamnose 3,5-epimerase|nr:dTDP-4-dehydrorhamnose 3,5-epimerase [Prevotellaceae bacterium]